MSPAKIKPKSAKPEARSNAKAEIKGAEHDGTTGDDGQEILPPEAIEPGPDVTPEEAAQARKKYLLKRFWISARGYWSRKGDSFAWPLTIGLLALIGINVGFQYGINVWNRSIFDAIEKRDAHTVYRSIGQACQCRQP